MKSFIILLILLLSISSLMSVDFVTGAKVGAKTQREKTGTPKANVSFETTVGHQATVIVGGSTTGDAVFSGAAEEYSIYKSYFKYDYKVVVTSPGFWVFPEKELTMVRFNVSATNGYNSSEDMITAMEEAAAQSSEKNHFKAVLQFNRELDINYFDDKKRYSEYDADSIVSASTKILGLYYYLVEGDATCNPTDFYRGNIALRDTLNSEWFNFDYPQGIQLKSDSSQGGYELSSYPIDFSKAKNPEFVFQKPVFTLYDVYASADRAKRNEADLPGGVTHESIYADRKRIVLACESFQEEVINIQNRELSDTETIELEGGISATKELYARGNLEDMVFSFTTAAPLDWENVGLSIDFDIDVNSCIMPLPSVKVVSESVCNIDSTLRFRKSFGRENVTLMSDPSSREHKLRLFFKNIITDGEYDNLSKSIEALVLNAQYSGSGTVTIKLYAVDAVEVQDGDNNTIFNTGNGAVLHEWIFEVKGSSIMTPKEEKVN